MALTSTLSDDFNGPSRDTGKWTQFASGTATIAQSGGKVTATPGASTATVGYAGYDSASSTLDLTGSFTYIQIVTAVNAAVGCQQYFKLTKDASNNIQWILENGTLKPQKTVATVTSDITAGVTFSSTTHAYWRIRESGGNTFFDFSSDSITWTNHTSLANPFAITAVQVEFAAGTYQSVASPGTGVFDNFNVVPMMSWSPMTNQPLRNRVTKRQQPQPPRPNAVPRVSASPYVSYWKQSVNEPLRSRTPKRQQPPSASYEAFYSNPVTPATPTVASWEKPISQPRRVPKRQQPPDNSPPPVPQKSAAPYPSYWVQPVNQPLRKRIRPRQMPPENTPPPLRASASPYLSYWKQPVNQFLRNRLPKRLQVPKVVPKPVPTVYYVSNTGNDANDGQTTSTPWQTITKVNAHSFIAGDQIWFNGGQTFTGKIFVSQGGTTASPVVFNSYGTGRATISDTTDNAFFISNTAGIEIRNLIITGGATAKGNGSSGIGIFANDGFAHPHIVIDTCDVSQFTYGIGIGVGTAATTYSDITINNCNVNNNRDDGILTYSNVAYVPASPVYAMTNVTITSTIAHDNLGDATNITGATGNGVVLGVVNGATIDQCTAYNNGINNAFTGAGPVGLWAYNSNNVTIKRSVAYSNATGTVADGDGFDLDINTSNSIIEYCLAYNNYGAGILLFGAANTAHTTNTVRYNLCWGNGRNPLGTPYGEIALAGTYQSDAVYNNTFVARDTGTSNPYTAWFDGTANAGNTFRNNILYGATSPVTNTSSAWATSAVFMQGNDYFRSAGTQIKWGATTYTTLAAWRAAVAGQEQITGVNQGFTSDPLLFNPNISPTVTDPTILFGAQNLILESISPLKGTGIDLNANFGTNIGTQDYFGNSNATPFNVGATGVLPLVTSWNQFVNEPLRSRVPKRQQPNSYKAVPPGLPSTAPRVSYWKQPTNEPLRNRVPKRSQVNRVLPTPPRASASPYVSYWVLPINQPLRSRVPKRTQVNRVLPTPPRTSAAPFISYWVQPVNQALRSRVPKRQQPGENEPPALPQATQAPYVSYWVQPVSQYLRSRLPKRQQPGENKPTFPTAASQAPRLSYWVQPINQFLRKRLPKRQIPLKAQPPYPPAASQAPYVSYWRQQVNQPLKNRVPKRSGAIYPGFDAFYGTPLSNIPPVSAWTQPVNQPPNNRKPKRTQVNKANPPYPAQASQAPYLSYWVHSVNQFLKNRTPKRQQPPAPKPSNPPQASQAPYIPGWVRPVNQPLKSRVPKRTQVNRVLPNPPRGSVAPYVTYWIQQVNQALRSRLPKRQQPGENQPPAAPQGSAAPRVSYWVQPVNEPLRKRVPKRQQVNRVLPNPPQGSAPPFLSTWVHPVNEPLRNRVPKRTQVNKYQPSYPPLGSQAPRVSYWKQQVNQPLKSRVLKRQIPPVRTGALTYQATLYKYLGWIPGVQQFLRRRVPKRQQPTYTINRGNYNPIPNPPPVWNTKTVIISSGGKSTVETSGSKVANTTSGARIDSVSSGTKNETLQAGGKTTTVTGSEKDVRL